MLGLTGREVDGLEPKQFLASLAGEMSEIGEENAVNQKGDQFAIWIGVRLFGLEVGEVIEKVHLGAAKDNRCDLGIVDEEEEAYTLVQCKVNLKVLAGDFKGTHFNKNEIDEVLSAAKRIQNQKVKGNERWELFAERVRASGEEPRLILAVLGTIEPSAKEYAESEGVTVWDLPELAHQYSLFFNPAGVPEPAHFELPMGGHGKLEYTVKTGGKSNKLLLITIPAKTLSDLVEDHGNGLFQKNLRFAKSVNNLSRTIKDGIAGTIRETPEQLAFRHNGITVVCEKVEAVGSDSLKLTKPQIINGCQTSYAIYDFAREHAKKKAELEKLTRAFVLCKIVDDVAQIETLTESANLQNPISFRDRKANDALQSDIMHALADKKIVPVPIFYEKKENEWESVVDNARQSSFKVPKVKGRTYRKISNGLAGQMHLSLLGVPHDARDKKGILFENAEYYRAAFGYNLTVSERAAKIGSELYVLDKAGSGLEPWCRELLFGHAIHRTANAVAAKILPSKRDGATDTVLKAMETKSYWKFFGFHLSWAIRYIVQSRAADEGVPVGKLRDSLIGNDPSVWFMSPAKILEQFSVDATPKKREIFPKKQKAALAALGTWLGRVDEIAYGQVNKAIADSAFGNNNRYWGKRPATIKELQALLDDVLTGPDAEDSFPLPSL